MQDERDLNPEERETAESLGQLQPLVPRFQVRDVTAAVATASVRRQVWLWRAIAAALAMALLPTFLLRPPARTVERLVYVMPQAHDDHPRAREAPAAPPSQRFSDLADMSPDSYLATRNQVVAFGWRAMPRPRAWAPSPPDRSITSSIPSKSPAPPNVLEDLLGLFSGDRS